MARLGDVCTLRQGFQIPIEDQVQEVRDGYVRFIRIVDYTQHTDDIRYVKDCSKFYYVKADDIVMIRYGAAGEVGFGIEGVIANNLFLIEPNIEINKKYLIHYLKQPRVKSELLAASSSTTMPAINFKTVRELNIPEHTLTEQHDIVCHLDKIDSLILLRNEQLAKLDELVKSRFVELFGNRGENPFNYPTTTMGNVYKFQYGKGNNIPEDKGEYLCYGSNGVVGHHTEYNSEDSPIIGHIGAYAGIVNWGKGKHYVTYNGVICKLINDQVNPVYGYYLLQIQDYNTVAKSGAAQPFVSYKDLDVPIVNVPPLGLQNQFATFVEQIDKSKFEIQQSLEKLETLEKVLMQKYFG